jgi:transposase
MSIDVNNLPDDPELLKKLLLQQVQRNQYLEEQFRLAQQKQFGQSAEGFDAQGDLFDEVEDVVEQGAVEQVDVEQQDISYTRNKPKRKPLPKDLPREQIVHDIPESEKQCGCCGGELHKMSEDVSEKLDFIPAQVKVIEHIRPKYACRECEKTGTNNHINQATMPATPINKGIAPSSLLSQIITSKYQSALPLHSQEAMFKQYGIELSRKTMSDWVLKSSTLFEPLIQRFKQELLKQPVIHADETTVNVVNSDKIKSYMWLYCTGTDSPVAINKAKNQLKTKEELGSIPSIVLYDYHNSRAASCVVNYLDGYSGYLQVDGYQAYAQTQATLVGCWAHARRKFIEAKQVQGNKANTKKAGKADVALSFIQKLYGIESKLKDKTADEKHEIRQEQAKPIIDKLHKWLEQNQPRLIGKTKLAEAVNYLVNQWPKLIIYLEDGHLNIDNNRAERAIKPFVIGRKNWMFSQTANGANASSALYSVIETAKANGLIPFDYIMKCLDKLCQAEAELDSLLPWNIKN